MADNFISLYRLRIGDGLVNTRVVKTLVVATK